MKATSPQRNPTSPAHTRQSNQTVQSAQPFGSPMVGPQAVLTLQRSIGNRATTRHLASGGLPAASPPLSRTGLCIQRSLGRETKKYALQKSSGKKFQYIYHDVEKGKNRWKYFLINVEDLVDGVQVYDDDEDFNWVNDEPEAENNSNDTPSSGSETISNSNLPQQKSKDKSSTESEILPLSLRPAVKLYMEQGCAGHLGRVQLFSWQFSTCSPVILFNAQTKIGGLYHYAAGEMDEEKRNTLTQMINVIKPTTIYLLQGGQASPGLDEESITEKTPKYMIPDWYYIKQLCQELKYNDVVVDKNNKWGKVNLTLAEQGDQVSITSTIPEIKHDLSNMSFNFLPKEFQHFGAKTIDQKMWF